MKKPFSLLAMACLGSGLHAQVSTGGQVAARVAERQAASATFTTVDLFAAAPKSDDRDEQVAEVVDDAVILTADAGALATVYTQRPSELSFQIPTNEGPITLQLLAADLFSDDFSIVMAGTGLPVDEVPGAHYQGIIKGRPNTLAAISIFKDEVMGLVSDEQGDHVLGRLEGSINEHIYYNDVDLKMPTDAGCFTPDDGGTYTKEDLKEGGPKTIKCVDLYWEVNYDVYQNKGANTSSYVTGLFNQHQILYTNDGISVQLSQLYIWNVASPYTSTSTSGLLSQFQGYRNSFNGDLANLVGFAGGGGIAAGFSGLCNGNLDNSMCYSGIQSSYNNVPTYSWSVMVVTHEQGHLLGSRHTHACVWNGNNTAIDGCGQQAGYSEGSCSTGPIPSGGGTIMSYCHLNAVGINFNNGFGTQPKNLITNNVNNAACLTACGGGACGTPGGLSATGITTSSATVNWGAVSGATSYTLQWKLSTSGTWTTVTGLTSTSHALNGLTANTTYTYQVQAVCASGSSAYSATAGFTTLPTGGCPDALEPNNSTAAPAIITLPASINALIASGTDADYYRFTTTAITNISIGMSNLAGDFDLRLLNSAGTQLAISQAGGTTSESITYNNAAAGTYYVHAYGYNGAYSATQCYLLTVSATVVSTCGDPYEPNNSINQYYTVGANTTRTALISSSTDQDWFRFANTSTKKNIKVNLSTLPADYDLRLYRNSTYLAVSQNGGTTAEQIIYNTSTVSANYKANIYGYNGAFSTSSCYTLTISIGSSQWLPGGNLEEEAIGAGAWKEGDGLVVFPNPAGEQVTVVLPPSDASSTIELLDAMGRVILGTEQRNAGGEFRFVMDVRDLPGGLYLVRVTRGGESVIERVMIGR